MTFLEMFVRSVPRPIAPWLALPALIIVKKVVVYGLLQRYGFPKLYRNIMRINRQITTTNAQYAANRDAVQTLFRLPNQVLNTSHEMAGQLTQMAERLSEQHLGFLPPSARASVLSLIRLALQQNVKPHQPPKTH